MDGLGGTLFQAMIHKMNDYLNAAFGSLMASFGGMMRVIVTLYIVILGYNIIMGNLGSKTREAAISIVLIGVLQTMILETSTYKNWVVSPVRDTTLNLASFVTSIGGDGDLGNLFANIDNTMGKLIATIDRMEPQGNFFTSTWLYIKTAIAMTILGVMYGLVYLAFLALLILAFFSMYIMFLVGGICIFFASFKETRFIFWSWFRAVINYAVWAVFLSIVMSICMFGVGKAIDALAANDVSKGVFTIEYGAALLMAGITLMLLFKASDYASQLTGGTSTSAGGVAGGIGMVAGGIGTGAAMGMNNQYTRTIAASTAGAARDVVVNAYSKLRGLK